LRRLQKEYPESPEAKNALFVLGRSLLELGRKQQATKVFKDMFAGSGEFSASQILTAGQELYKVGEFAIALEAFDRVLASTDERAFVEPAMLARGKLLIDDEKYQEGAQSLEQMLAAFPNSGYTPDASLYLSRAYGDMAMLEPDADRRFDLFNDSIKHMKTVRKFETTPGGIARSDLELGLILERKARAEEKNGTAAKALEYRREAIAALQTLILLGDFNDGKVRAQMEEALHACIPLMTKIKRWQDVVDDCDKYLEMFPNGTYTVDMRKWRNEARIKLSTSAPAAPLDGE
jgi:tetratricopeptide (TPR) repeat protein